MILFEWPGRAPSAQVFGLGMVMNQILRPLRLGRGLHADVHAEERTVPEFLIRPVLQ